MLIPIVAAAVFLGRAFDMKTMLPSNFYIFDKDLVKENKLVIEKPFTRSEYKLVETSADVNSFLEVNGELAIKAKKGDISLSGIGNYLSESVQRDKTVELLLRVNYESVTETFPSYLAVLDAWQNRSPSEVGTHYIRSIVYGGQLIISYQLKAHRSENLEKIKAAVNAHLATSGSLNGDVKGNIEKIEKSVSGLSDTKIHVYATAGNITQTTSLEDLFQMIDRYPSMIKDIKAPLKLELEPLGTLNTKFPSALKHEAAREVLHDAIDKFDDMKNARSILYNWYPPEEMEDEVKDYGDQLEKALSAMKNNITTMDLSKDVGVHHFDVALEIYAAGGFNVPLRYTRNLTRLMNKAKKITPKWYSYTRAVKHYTHWGSVNCTLPSPQPLVVGLAVAAPSGFGSGSNLLCFGLEPALDSVSLSSGTKTSAINGLTFLTTEGTSGPLFCAQCQLENATSVITVPGKKDCPANMKLEYSGFLATGSEAVSVPICVDNNPDNSYEGIYPHDDSTASAIKPVWINCEDCVESEKFVPCVVCSR